MKQLFYLAIFTVLLFAACKKDNDTYPTYQVTIQLTDTSGINFSEAVGVTVKLTADNSANVYEGTSDATGKAVITVPAGIYRASVSFTKANGVQKNVYNGAGEGTIAVTDAWTNTTITKVKLIEAQLSQIVIKEVFVGGTPKDDGSGPFNYDRYVILYNNSTTSATLKNICLATTMPYNSTGSNSYIGADGALTYAKSGWIPAGLAFWYFQSDVALAPGKQVVIALTNAVNNTTTYSKSINFDKSEYYCTYDLVNFSHAATYVAPSASIPTSHYLKAAKYGQGTAWTLSQVSPGFFIFNTKEVTPQALGADVSYNDAYPTSTALISKKIPVSWIVDGVEAYSINGADNKKRLTPQIDAGYVYHTNSQGYSIYRNVDKIATEAIAGNAGKLVYNYSMGTTSIGTGGTTDPSGIDAEASIKNGATIIYMDTNNSTADFHLRSKASLRTN